MLTVNPAKRITAAEALKHPWICVCERLDQPLPYKQSSVEPIYWIIVSQEPRFLNLIKSTRMLIIFSLEIIMYLHWSQIQNCFMMHTDENFLNLNSVDHGVVFTVWTLNYFHSFPFNERTLVSFFIKVMLSWMPYTVNSCFRISGLTVFSICNISRVRLQQVFILINLIHYEKCSIYI